MSIQKKLMMIQKGLHAPKNQYNKFGKFYYRNLEDILEAVKPLLAVNGCTLTITDDIRVIGDRYYVEAIATLSDGENEIKNHALARESETKKGMDESQITGATSSYARKYCLNGLFAIDDNKDADSDHDTEDKPEPVKAKPKAKKTAAITKKMEAVKTMDELIELWKSLTPNQRAAYEDDKNRLKEEFSNANAES